MPCHATPHHSKHRSPFHPHARARSAPPTRPRGRNLLGPRASTCVLPLDTSPPKARLQTHTRPVLKEGAAASPDHPTPTPPPQFPLPTYDSTRARRERITPVGRRGQEEEEEDGRGILCIQDEDGGVQSDVCLPPLSVTGWCNLQGVREIHLEVCCCCFTSCVLC